MSDKEKKPAHELLLTNLEHHVPKVVPDADTVSLALSSGCTTLILYIMHNMVIPDKHREEIVQRLRGIASTSVSEQLTRDISALADRLAKEG